MMSQATPSSDEAITIISTEPVQSKNEHHLPAPESSPVRECSPTPYTIFTSKQRRLLIPILVLTMLASPMTATVYLPLLPLLASHFHVSNQAINLTITVYIIFQALSPAFFATLSDSLGRRPIYLVTFGLYTAASLGLALNKSSYPALLILRAVQSTGASAVLAIAYGVVADLCVPAERGKMLGPVMGAANVAVCVGPIVGGLVVSRSGSYEWVFWFLAVFGGVTFLSVGWGLFETGRNVIGNGSVAAKGWNRTWWSWLLMAIKVKSRGGPGLKQKDGEADCNEVEKGVDESKKKIRLANPLACLRIMFHKDVALILWIAASPYAVYYCIQTSIPSIYNEVYGFSALQIGLSYLPGGVGVVIGGYLNGKTMDRNYKKTAKEIGFTVDRVSGDNLNHFPIEKARARHSYYLCGVYVCALIGYGWSVKFHAHESIPLILQFVLAVLCTCFQQIFNALLVDIFPENPSMAAASGNLTRCTLSAIAVATLQPLVNAMGRGWYFTTLSFVSGGSGMLAAWAAMRWGMGWRTQRVGAAARPIKKGISEPSKSFMTTGLEKIGKDPSRHLDSE